MTTPPADGPSRPDPDTRPWDPAAPPAVEQVSLDKPAAPFDPYRYGAPEHPVPAEYAPPGYTPPPVTTPPRTYPPQGYPAQGPQYLAPPPYAQQYPQPRTGNGKSIASLVLGILAIVAFWTSILDVVLIVPAVIFGILGLSDAKRGGGGRGMAIGGLVCALVGAIVATIFSVVIYNRLRPCLDFDRGSSAYNHCIQDRI